MGGVRSLQKPFPESATSGNAGALKTAHVEYGRSMTHIQQCIIGHKGFGGRGYSLQDCACRRFIMKFLVG